MAPVTVLLPETVDEVVAALGAEPEATLLAGGTDLMVEVNAGQRRLGTVISLRRVAELARWWTEPAEPGTVWLGARVTHSQLTSEPLASLLPALASAARTVGSPQIRNTGTIGGNLGTASPAGDTLPVLVALDARIRTAGPDGVRTLPVGELLAGPKRTSLAAGEIVTAVGVPQATGPQAYLKVGVRNAMVIAVASLALVVDTHQRRVGVGLGSVGPVPLRAPEAEQYLAEHIRWEATRPTVIDLSAVARFAELVAASARPIDDHRASAAYRRDAVGVLVRRLLQRAFPS